MAERAKVLGFKMGLGSRGNEDTVEVLDACGFAGFAGLKASGQSTSGDDRARGRHEVIAASSHGQLSHAGSARVNKSVESWTAQ